MFRLLAIFTLVIGCVAEAWADIPSPPPPAGQKYVDVVNQVRLGKELDDYVFFIAHGRGPGAPRYEYTKITLSTKSSTSMPRGGRYQYVALLAVPKASADQVQSDDPGAFVPGRLMIAGLQRIGFADTATVDAKHPGGSVTRTYTITGFDQDGVIQTTVEREPADVERETKSKSRAEVGPGKTSSAVAAIALALSFAVGGIQLVRKRRALLVQTRDESCNGR
jgi:hypothetical protein